MLQANHLNTMLNLQDKMNSKVSGDWIQVASPFLRAVVIEAAEAIEHHGWKWWKKQGLDLEQLQMELVDIWHFLLSEIILRQQGDIAKAAEQTLAELEQQELDFDGKHYQLSDLSLLEKLELLIGLSSAKRIHLPLFAAILEDCQMNWLSLYQQYVGKNVLNFFRQDHGYKLGTYNKIWQGREDNEHLVELLNELDQNADNFQDLLYQGLSERYLQS